MNILKGGIYKGIMGKIRILNIVSVLVNGGIESVIYNNYKFMDKDKFQMDILVTNSSLNNMTAQKKFEDLGCNILKLNSSSTDLIRHKKEFEELLRRNKYDILHMHAQMIYKSVYGLIAKKLGVKVRILHSHTSSIPSKKKDIVNKCLRWLIPYASDYRLACSDLAGKYLFGKRDFIVFKNAIDLEKYYYDEKKRILTRKSYGISDDTLLVGHVGRVSGIKNHSFMVEVAKVLKDRGTDFRMMFVGEERENTEALKTKIRNYGLTEYVRFMGGRSDAENFYNAFDVHIFPSLFEGLGITMIEAQACGCPCIASDRIPPETKITEDVTFLPIDEGSESIWADKIIEYSKISHKDNSSKVRAEGYDIKCGAKVLENLYIDFLKQSDVKV